MFITIDKTRRLLVALMIVLALFAGLSVANATPANAGNCTAPGLCGKVENVGATGLLIRRDFGSSAVQRTLYQGQHSTTYYADTDQVYIPSGKDLKVCIGSECWMLRNTGWHKITDNFKEYDMTLVRDGYQLPWN